MDTLEQMRDVQDTIATPFDDFDLVIEPFYKSTCLPIKKVIGSFIYPFLSRCQERIEAMYRTAFHTLHPSFERILRSPFCHMLLKNLRECIAQLIANFQLRRMHKETIQLLFVLRSDVFFSLP